MALRLEKLLLVAVLAALASGCPRKESEGDKIRQMCAMVSNTELVGKECRCKYGYRKVVQTNDSFQCVLDGNTSCLGNSRFDSTRSSCVCNNGRTYDINSPTPCGYGHTGMGLQQLEQACQQAAGTTWLDGFCNCGQGRQFNALTRACESNVYHHYTQDMCGANAAYYGYSGRGICICNDSNAIFNPSFGGCSTSITESVISTMCSNLYHAGGVVGNTASIVGNACTCPRGMVWFRGSCLDLGHDFVTQVIPSIPVEVREEIRCELQGQRLVGGRCENLWGGGGYFGGSGPVKPLSCDRRSLINGGRERVVLHGSSVEVITYYPYRRHMNYNAQDYFRTMCEGYALHNGMPMPMRVGTYHPGKDDPYYGKCSCLDGFVAYRDDLGYEYCVSPGSHPGRYSRCGWDLLANTQVGVNYDPENGFSGEVCIRAKDSRSFCLSTSR